MRRTGRLILLFAALMLTTPGLQGQDNKRNNIWMIGGDSLFNMGIDFNSGIADTFSLARPMEFFVTNAGICDTNGQLLFYTNGDYIANRNHERLLNSTNYNPTITDDSVYGSNIAQSIVVLPYPGTYDQYIIFHENGEHLSGQYQPIELRYSVVDMALDSGLGGIVPGEKGIPILSDTLILGRVTACKHGNGRDWWVITHRYNSDLYYKILVTPGSVQVFSQYFGSNTINDALGQAVFSPDGSQYALLNYNPVLDLMHFNRCTGRFSNLTTIQIPDSDLAAVGCAFSPSGRFLYVSNNLHVFQYDTWSANIAGSIDTVATWDSTIAPGANFFMMQLAPDNKIYISTFQGTNILHVINDPDSLGIACNLIQHGITLPSYNAQALPNAPNYGLGDWMGSSCDSLPVNVATLATKSHVAVYPNPVTGPFFTVDYSGMKNKNVILEVFNQLGEKIFSENLSTPGSIKMLDVSGYSYGLYILRIISGNMSSSVKFIKE